MRNVLTWDVLHRLAHCLVCNGCLLQMNRYPRPHAPTKALRVTEAVAKAADLLEDGNNAAIVRAMTEASEIWTQNDHAH